MNSLEYIESGMLELYVLDKLSPLEKVEVENMASRFPEVAKEIKSIQEAFEREALQNAMVPRAHLQDKIAQKLQFRDETAVSNPIIVESKSKIKALRFYQLSLAACFTLLVISTISLWNMHNQLDETQRKYLAALTDTRKYASETRFLENENKQTQTLLSDTNTLSIRLKGIKAFAGSGAIVFYNKKEHTVVLNAKSLPKNDSAHSYQLWAIVKNKPVDGGIFEVENGLASLNTMKSQSDVEAFAITLEPKGGSPSPHLDQLVGLTKI